MRIPLRSQPKSPRQRAEAVAEDAADFVRSLPGRLDTSRKRALAVAGGAATFAAGFAFGRARGDDGPSVHSDPAKPAPWRMTPSPQVPADSAASTEDKVSTRSK
jgi:hypothetical protein